MDPCNNTSNNTNSSSNNMEPFRNAVIGTSVVSLFGFPANLLVIVLVIRAKQKRSTATYLLLSLAIADLVNLLCVDSFAIMVYLVDHHRYKNRATLALMTIPPKIVVNFTFAMIALERYNALVKTIINITRKNIRIWMFVSWFVGLAIPTSMFACKMWLHEECDESPSWLFKVFLSVLIVVGHIIPLFIVIICYANILKGLYFDRTILGQNIITEMCLDENKRLIRILLLITLVFVTCNSVPTIIILVLKYLNATEGKVYLYMMLVFLGSISSTLNPYIYGLQSKKYRNQVKELFRCHQQEELRRVASSPHVYDTKL